MAANTKPSISNCLLLVLFDNFAEAYSIAPSTKAFESLLVRVSLISITEELFEQDHLYTPSYNVNLIYQPKRPLFTSLKMAKNRGVGHI